MTNKSLKTTFQEEFKFTFWARFVAILHFITGGLAMLFGIISIPVGIFYIGDMGKLLVMFGIISIPVGMFYIFSGIKLWEGAETAERIKQKKEDTMVDEDTFSLINSYHLYNKNIVFIIIIYILIIILGFAFFAAQSATDSTSPAIESQNRIEMEAEDFELDDFEITPEPGIAPEPPAPLSPEDTTLPETTKPLQTQGSESSTSN